MSERGIKERLAFMAEGIDAQEGFNWREYKQLCVDALASIEQLERGMLGANMVVAEAKDRTRALIMATARKHAALRLIVKETPFTPTETGLDLHVSFETITSLQAALKEGI